MNEGGIIRLNEPTLKAILPLRDLSERHPGLTRNLGNTYVEAARVCLDRHHQSPTDFALNNNQEDCEVVVEWEITDSHIKGAYANEIDTTEQGAYACVLAAIELAAGLVAVRRAETLTGADYYVAPANTIVEDLEQCLRLEVSGVDRGIAQSVERRLRQKLEQAARGASNLPALAGVVGFHARLIMLKKLEESQ